MTLLTSLQLKRLQVLYGQYARQSLDAGTTQADRLAWASKALRREIGSFSAISLDEARTLIDGLQRALGVKAPNQAPRRASTRREREKQGTEGRRDQIHDEITLAGPREQQLIAADLERLGWDDARLGRFLTSKRNPIAGATTVRTLWQANRLHWALKRLKPDPATVSTS